MRVFFFGAGYCARRFISRERRSIEASGSARSGENVRALRADGVEAYLFDGARAEPGIDKAIERAEALVVSIPPRDEGERASERFAPAIATAPDLRRIVYYSSVGVYGDHGGAWIDETAETHTRTERGLARVADEARWREAGRARRAEVDILRLAGIYGPGRNALVKLRTGEARRIVRAGHVLNRVHVDDIAEFTRLVLTRGLDGQIWNVADGAPAPPQDVVAYAATLLGVAPPLEAPYGEASVSPAAQRFFVENRRVSIAKAKALLGFAPAFPTYREGLNALAAAGEGRTS